MSGTEILAAGAPLPLPGPARPAWRGRLRSADFRWAVAFVLPYAAVFFAFVVLPFGDALWLGGKPALYGQLIETPDYPPAVLNTLLFVGLGVNVKMLLALLLSGFFLRPRRWIRALLGVFVLPWLIAAAQACLSFHWMLIVPSGLFNGLLQALFGLQGPVWLADRWLALGADIAAYIWKWLPFWTVILIAGRMTIPREFYDAAAVDGATGLHRFRHVTLPLLANLYLVSTLLSTIWTLGDFTTVTLVSSDGPALSTQVLATLGFHYAFDLSDPALGVAAVLSALPLLIVIVIVLMRRLQRSAVEL